MGHKFTYFTIGLFYLQVLTDIIGIIFLGTDDTSGGETGLIVTMFFIERILTVTYRVIKTCMSNKGQGSQDIGDICMEIVLAAFFADFFLAGCQMASWQKEQEKWMANQRQLAAANNGKVPRSQNKPFKCEKPLPKIPPSELHIIRAYAYTMIAMFINIHAQMTGMGTNAALVINIIVQIISFTTAIGEVYHINTHEDIPIKERLFMYWIIAAEMMAKLFLWGYFAQLTGQKGVWVLLVIELVGGFILEVSYQCLKEEEDDMTQAKGIIKSMFGPCGNLEYCIKMGMLPLLVGFQVAFYGRYEDIMVRELDEEPKQMKKGNIPLAIRAFEFLVLIVCGFVQISGDQQSVDGGDDITTTKMTGFFIFGFLGAFIFAGWASFFTYKKYCKKDPVLRSFRPLPLQYEEGAATQVANNIIQKGFNFFKKGGKKEEKYKENEQSNNKNNNQNQQQQQGDDAQQQLQQNQQQQQNVNQDQQYPQQQQQQGQFYQQQYQPENDNNNNFNNNQQQQEQYPSQQQQQPQYNNDYDNNNIKNDNNNNNQYQNNENNINNSEAPKKEIRKKKGFMDKAKGFMGNLGKKSEKKTDTTAANNNNNVNNNNNQ